MRATPSSASSRAPLTSVSALNLRYIVDDVDAAVASTQDIGLTLLAQAGPAFADVVRGELRLFVTLPDRVGAP